MASPRPSKKNSNINSILNDNFGYISIVLVIILLGVSYLFFIKPKFDNTLALIKSNIEQQEQFYQNQKQKLADLKAAADFYKQLKPEDISRVENLLPDEYAKEKLFGELDDILARQGVLLSNITLYKSGEVREGGDKPMISGNDSISNPLGSKHIGTIRAELSLSAVDYSALKKVLPILEDNLQLMDVESLEFNPDSKSLHLVINTYYYR